MDATPRDAAQVTIRVAREVLDRATRYSIHKTEAGVMVGLQLEGRLYAEGHSPSGDLDAAVLQAYHRSCHSPVMAAGKELTR